VRVHWQSGAVTVGFLERRLPIAQQLKTPVGVVERIRQLHGQNKSRKWIADQLNREGLRTGGGLEFTAGRVAGILERWKLCGSEVKSEPNGCRTAEEVVARIVELYQQGKSPREVAQEANREGLRTAQGLPFNAMWVRALLGERHISRSQPNPEK
jgi:hypothetical protein